MPLCRVIGQSGHRGRLPADRYPKCCFNMLNILAQPPGDPWAQTAPHSLGVNCYGSMFARLLPKTIGQLGRADACPLRRDKRARSVARPVRPRHRRNIDGGAHVWHTSQCCTVAGVTTNCSSVAGAVLCRPAHRWQGSWCGRCPSDSDRSATPCRGTLG